MATSAVNGSRGGCGAVGSPRLAIFFRRSIFETRDTPPPYCDGPVKLGLDHLFFSSLDLPVSSTL